MLLTPTGILQDFSLAFYSCLSATSHSAACSSYSFYDHIRPSLSSFSMISVHCMVSLSLVFPHFCPFQPKIFRIHLVFLVNFFHNAILLLSPLQSIPSTHNIGLKFVNQHSRPSTVHPHLPLWIVSEFHMKTQLHCHVFTMILPMLLSPPLEHPLICPMLPFQSSPAHFPSS